ncbi:MaoC family dehydratase [Mycobacterium sp. NAZ190054]|uniref:MaoC family dehydratase n=1 Tax=Mycobacterium sp. NAZ190054 TaxID=1747766 RepID=UPI00079C0AB1|nr:MaoC family dehydratase [Mycobacterium sp. NAZ190054]KWX69261.1 hypothetical protein ASJ79_00230 [Mycobacterium sp. NAZ190054]
MTAPAGDLSWADRDDWQEAWQPLADQIGTDFADGAVIKAADAVEPGAVRRYLEPLEFDCPLHHDAEVARAHGYAGIVAPYSGLATWTSAALWSPGEAPVYTSAERDAQPQKTSVPFHHVGPATNGGFATDVEYEFAAPVLVGDHLEIRGCRLLSVTPKETKVGRGAFTTWEFLVLNQRRELVCTQRRTLYRYVARRTVRP